MTLTAWPGDIGIVQRIDVEINAFDRAQPVGQGAQQRRKFARFRLASAMLTALKAKGPAGGVCANRPKSAEITVAIWG